VIILTTPRVHSVADNPNNTPNNSEGLQVVSLIILIILLIIPRVSSVADNPSI
jgi:hypothetical protein